MQKEKLREIHKYLKDKDIDKVMTFQFIKFLMNFYGVSEKTAKLYLKEMVAFGFLAPGEGSYFEVK